MWCQLWTWLGYSLIFTELKVPPGIQNKLQSGIQRYQDGTLVESCMPLGDLDATAPVQAKGIDWRDWRFWGGVAAVGGLCVAVTGGTILVAAASAKPAAAIAAEAAAKKAAAAAAEAAAKRQQLKRQQLQRQQKRQQLKRQQLQPQLPDPPQPDCPWQPPLAQLWVLLLLFLLLRTAWMARHW